MGLLKDILDGTDDDSLGELLAENAQFRLWRNEMTKSYEKQLGEYDTDGFTLQGKYIVVLAENKITGDRSYLMMDKITQKPIADWTDQYSFDFKKILILDDLKQDCDIINMAKANKKKKKRKAKI